MKLKLEQIIRHADGYTITHSRAKQRGDKKATKFVVPQEGYQGRVWYTGTNNSLLKKQFMWKINVPR
jgi:hypothetical protein